MGATAACGHVTTEAMLASRYGTGLLDRADVTTTMFHKGHYGTKPAFDRYQQA